MTVEGSLDLFKLPEILQLIAQQRKTGILTIQGGNDIVAISFLRGDVVGADSLNQPGEESLIAVLEAQGFLGADQIMAVQAAQQRSGRPLNEALVAGGFLSRQDLLRALRVQYVALLQGLLGWRQGEFKFYANDEVSYEEGLEPIQVQSLLLNAPYVEEPVAEPAGPEPLSLDFVFERVPGADPRRVDALGTGRGRDGGGISLSAIERSLIAEVDGRRPLREVARAGGIAPRAAAEAIDNLEVFGLVQRRAGGTPFAAPASRQAPPPPEPKYDLQEEVFAPPLEDEEELLPEPEVGFQRRRVFDLERSLSMGATLVGLVATLLLGLALFVAADRILFAAPWQKGERAALDDVRRNAHFLKVDRAAKTYFLLNGRFPEELRELVDLHLLGSVDLVDTHGRDLAYDPADSRYEIAPIDGGEPMLELANDEAITGNFLLDYDFFSLEGPFIEKPLVLID